jgi:NADP-dependent 3-hydroxy acid dehydrogenase YdfG
VARRRPTPSINGRTAVITGAGSGIGRAVAQRLAAHGSPVAIADWNEEGLEETAQTIEAAGGTVMSRRLDVRDRQAQMAFAAEVDAWKPAPLGMVFNNAGVTVLQGVTDASPEDDEWVLDINLRGVMHGVRSFLPLLVAQDAGVLVNTSSVFGLVGFPHQSAYCASKFAVRGYTDAIRQELRGTGVRAVVVHPGGVKTNIVANARFRASHRDDPDDTHERAIKDFASLARTSPERAAKIIHNGIEAGKSRILIGPDAHFLDLLVRTAPERYYGLVARMDALIQKRGARW